jgi:hypothetical protein
VWEDFLADASGYLERPLIGFWRESKRIEVEVIKRQTVMANNGPENEFEKSL